MKWNVISLLMFYLINSKIKQREEKVVFRCVESLLHEEVKRDSRERVVFSLWIEVPQRGIIPHNVSLSFLCETTRISCFIWKEIEIHSWENCYYIIWRATSDVDFIADYISSDGWRKGCIGNIRYGALRRCCWLKFGWINRIFGWSTWTRDHFLYRERPNQQTWNENKWTFMIKQSTFGFFFFGCVTRRWQFRVTFCTFVSQHISTISFTIRECEGWKRRERENDIK